MSSFSYPSMIFVIPYREREEHRRFFLRYISYILEDYDKDSYEIVFVHQCIHDIFNRGAMKNIGFIYAKHKYPRDYQNISFVFHDIDVMSSEKGLLEYQTSRGTIKHYYGFDYALGGIVSVNGFDMDKLNGFPNYWGWGLEDNCFQKRSQINRITIDRSTFFKIGHMKILHIHDGFLKPYSDKNTWRLQNDTGLDGIRSVQQLKYSCEKKTSMGVDYIMCNVSDFYVPVDCNADEYYERNMSTGNKLKVYKPPKPSEHPIQNNTKNKHNTLHYNPVNAKVCPRKKRYSSINANTTPEITNTTPGIANTSPGITNTNQTRVNHFRWMRR